MSHGVAPNGDVWRTCDACAERVQRSGGHFWRHDKPVWLALFAGNTYLDLCPKCAPVALDALEQATGLDTSRLRVTT